MRSDGDVASLRRLYTVVEHVCWRRNGPQKCRLGAPRASPRHWIGGKSLNIRSTLIQVEILPSALKHDVATEDILHAFDNCIEWLELDDDPLRYLLVGPDRAGNLLELVVVIADDVELLIHAMPLRRGTAEELFGGQLE